MRLRAEGRTITLLAPGSRDVYAAGFDAGVAAVGEAVILAVDETRLYATGNYPEAAGPSQQETSADARARGADDEIAGPGE